MFPLDIILEGNSSRISFHLSTYIKKEEDIGRGKRVEDGLDMT